MSHSDCPQSDPCAFWQWYIWLQQAEAAFRLCLRSVFHQKTQRVEAHILVCFLALALWRTLQMWMRGKGLDTCARQLLKEVATVRSMDVILPVKDRGGVRLRVVAASSASRLARDRTAANFGLERTFQKAFSWTRGPSS
jgi:hypothetical protein